MKMLSAVGVVLLILGVLLLLIPIPHRETHGFNAGSVRFGIQTTQHEKVHPAICGVLIAGGVGLLIAGARKSR